MMDVLLSDFDWESSSESGSSELEEIEFSYGGQAQSIFSSLEESLGKIDDFLSFERGFLHGDIVCSVTDPSGQMGRVININVLVDLENVHGRYIKEVDSKKLLKIRSLSVGDYVVQGTWVGRVDKVVDLVCVIFDDGSKYEITAVDQENLVPVSPNLLEDSQFSYYPGQRVRVRLSHLPKSARWLCGNWRENQEEGTVSAVEAGLVYVDWVASALMGSDLSSPAPPRLQDPKNLILLSCFPHATWRLGDWCMFPIASHKGTMEQVLLNTSACDVIKDHKKLERGFQSSNLTPTLDEIFAIVKTKSKVDVVWQDGTCSMAVDSRMVVPIGVVTSHEFWPEQFVMEKDIANCQRWGVVCTVDAKERTAKVQWKTRANSEANGFDEDQVEETVSAYELVEHPDFGFSFGDVVFRVVKGQFWDQTDKDHVSTANTVATENAVKHSNSGEDQNEYSEKDHLSSVGVVTGFKDGNVEVKWATGFTTKVAPYEIYHIDKYGSSATTAVSYEENSVELNQEMIEYDKQSSVELEKDLTSEDCEQYPRESSSFSLPRAAIGFFTSIAESLFGYHGSTSLSGPVTSNHNSEDQSESENLLKEEVLGTHDLSELGPSELQSTVNEHLKQEGKENEELQNSKLQNARKKSSQFRQFDIVTDCSDHHFFGASKGLAQSQVKRGWLKKVQEEWSILESNLPETIYIRVYEERMDLLRAALVGAPGTPYHDGLFFFDILLPPEYPYEPPLVHYNSGGLRLNPNLYESGKVCLSLLNTWTGTGSEVWNPQSSTILQVLLSLQALVLNEKPYFNEAGYDKQMGRTEGEKNSVSYNENAFLMTWKSMLYILRQPPKHFEALVEEHLRRRTQQILLACKTYMEGAPMGFNSRCAENEHENSKESSTGFKIMLGKLFPKLTEAFSGMGIGSSQSVEPTVDLDTTNSSILPCE